MQQCWESQEQIQKQAPNSHKVPNVTAQLLTLPFICGVMPLTLKET